MNERAKDFAKMVLGAGWFALARAPYQLLARPRVLPVFNYHGIETREVPHFRRQIEYLRRRWRFVALEEALPAMEGLPFEGGIAHLCFDDALKSIEDNALPVLAELGVPCTILVPTSLVGVCMAPPGPPEPLMSWESIRRLDSPAVRFESHTATHRCLTGLSDDEVRAEFATSREVLEGNLGRPVACVCYPAGWRNERVKALAREAGYRVGFSTLTHTDQSRDAFDVHRLLLRPSFSRAEIGLMMRGGYNWLTILAKMRLRTRRG